MRHLLHRVTIAILAVSVVAGAVVVPAYAKKSKKKSKPKPAVKILRGPYLQQTTKVSTFIVWQTDRAERGKVHYGKRRTTERTARESQKTTFHAVQIVGLRSNTRYVYRVRVGRTRTRPAKFTTMKRGPIPFNFGVIGDYGTGSGAEYKNARLMGNQRIEFVITTGDNIYGNGYDSEYNRGLFYPFGSLMRKVPFWPSLGNHDYGNDDQITRNNASAYFKNFILPELPAQERYYSFKWGNAEFWSINTEVGDYAPGSMQYEWLESTLAKSGACWKIPYFHRPPYSSRGSTYDLRTTVVPLFERYGVKLVLSGHQHNYERTAPLMDGVEDPNGITYVVTGGGGATLHKFRSSRPARTVFRGAFYHHLLISVNDKTMTVKAIGTSGKARDDFTLSCDQPAGKT